HPVFFGSAATGAGVASLTAGIRELLPAAAGDPPGPGSGAGVQVPPGAAPARLFSGPVRVRDRLRLGRDGEGKVSAIAVFEHGPAAVRRPSLAAGQIGKLWGLDEIRVGDQVGVPRTP